MIGGTGVDLRIPIHPGFTPRRAPSRSPPPPCPPPRRRSPSRSSSPTFSATPPAPGSRTPRCTAPFSVMPYNFTSCSGSSRKIEVSGSLLLGPPASLKVRDRPSWCARKVYRPAAGRVREGVRSTSAPGQQGRSSDSSADGRDAGATLYENEGVGLL
jgi:hypothetical protein